MQIKATGYLMRSYTINVRQGIVMNLKVILSPVGHGYATQAFSTFINGNYN